MEMLVLEEKFAPMARLNSTYGKHLKQFLILRFLNQPKQTVYFMNKSLFGNQFELLINTFK